jgi:pyridoxine kinase
MNEEEDCRVLSIQSHVVSGYVGNKSATFPLQVLGFDVDTINSVQFSNHTGYGVFKGQVLNAEDLEALYSGLAANDINHYSHLLTGYIGSKSFLLAVRDVIKDQKRLNPNLIYVCDPVMGDHGKLYVPEDLLSVYKESIVPLADILTPNQFEAELLTDIKITDIESAKAAMLKLHNMGAKMVVISSSDLALEKDTLVALASNFKNGTSESLKIDIPKLPFDFTGTGDLFAALLLAWTHRHPDNLKLACEMVLSTMHQVLKKTLAWSQRNKKEGKDLSVAQTELRLIQCKNDIENPQLSIEATVL